MQIESLESRRLLTATFEIDGSVLRITGTDKRDDVSFGLSPDGTQFDINIFEDGALSVQQNFFSVNDITLISANLGDGADTIILGEVPIALSVNGGRGPDSLSGGAGNDTLLGGGGSDYLFGREGNDSLVGGLQGDEILGGKNNDILVALSDLTADDTIAGGGGTDTVDYSTVTDNVFVYIGNDLPDPQEDDSIAGDVEVIIGSAQDDEIINGTRRGMQIDGRAGNDTLTGGSGNDSLIGGAGSDELNGKGGNDSFNSVDGELDTLDGGRDVDVIVSDISLDAIFNG